MKTKTAFVKRLQGLTFVGKTDTEHWVVMDGPKEVGGSNAGIRPKEMLLLGLAGCTSMDVVSILTKKHVQLREYEVEIRAEQAEEHPQVYSTIHLQYILRGEGIEPRDVEHAIQLSQERYCSVTAMLRTSVEITHGYRIEP